MLREIRTSGIFKCLFKSQGEKPSLGARTSHGFNDPTHQKAPVLAQRELGLEQQMFPGQVERGGLPAASACSHRELTSEADSELNVQGQECTDC